MSTVQKLTERGLVKPPKFLPNNIHYETIMGSVAYGVSSDTSDMDVYGFCIPEKDMVFPHLRGEIPGFGRQIQRFEQWQEHHVLDKDALGGKGRTYDLTIYSIIKYFQLCLENNSKQAPEGKRKETVEQHGFDLKYAYHVVRLLDEVEQILTEGDIDLQRNREQLKSIRRGEWTQEAIVVYFERKEKELETLYTASKLQHSPDEAKVKQLLMDCLEQHYGSLADCVVDVDAATQALRDIQAILDRANRKNSA